MSEAERQAEREQYAQWFATVFRRLEGAFGPAPGGEASVEEWCRVASGHSDAAVEAGIDKLCATWVPEYGRRFPVPAEFRKAIPLPKADEQTERRWERLLSAVCSGATAHLGADDLAAVGGEAGLAWLTRRVDEGRTGYAYRAFVERVAHKALPAPARRALPPHMAALVAAADAAPGPDARPRASRATRVLAAVPDIPEPRPVDQRALDAQRSALKAWTPPETTEAAR